MKHYFVSNNSKLYLDILKEKECSILCSYYYLNNSLQDFKNTVLYNYPYDIFLDCGAYSALIKKIKINFNSYLEFCIKYQNCFEKIAVLDIQPKGMAPKDFKESGFESFKNYQEMKKYIPLSKLVPVFHYGEDFEYLKQYITDKIDVIALGGLASRIKTERFRVIASLPWFAQVFRMYPKQKFHGFGIFNSVVNLNFPFYSMDSTWWLFSGRYGRIIRFDEKKLSIRMEAPRKRKTWLDPDNKDYFMDYLDSSDTLKYPNRAKLAIREIKKYIDFITKLWEVRGIKWN